MMRAHGRVVALPQEHCDRGRGDISEDSALFRLVNEASPDIIYVYDRLRERYPFVSGRCKEILGYAPQDIQRLKARDVERLIHPADLERARAHYARQAALSDHEVAHTTYRVACASGEYRLLRCRQKVFSRGRDGVVVSILGVATDITDQVNRERELDGLRAQILSIRDDERRRIALRLHDTALQHLVGAALLLKGIEMERTSVDCVANTIRLVRTSLSQALREILKPLTT
jgi:PAS domain S-box-containing protein